MTTIKNTIPVSVVIPCYECSATIRRAVDSVLEQSVMPYEIILVDDNSKDNTLYVLHDLANLYPKLITILEMKINRGAASARNAGWSITKQPYIAFLDADDSWHPDKLRIQYEYMKNHPEVALSGHQCVFKSQKQSLKLNKRPVVTIISPLSLLFKNAFSTTSPIMLKTNIPFRFKEGMRFSEDFFLWLQIAFEGLQIVRIEKPLSYFYKHSYGEDGLSSRLWEMEKGELNNFFNLFTTNKINLFFFIAASFFSFIKFLRRLFLTLLRKKHLLSIRKR